MKKSILRSFAIAAIAILTITGIISCKKDKTIIPKVDTRPTDMDGNIYDTIVIGTQVWMLQNLKTSRYNDGTAITIGLNNTTWNTATTGAYAIYNDIANSDSTYGKLYNWFAINTGKLAPIGWHIPSDAEWTTLSTYLGGESFAGDKMKATTLWSAYAGITNTNSSGFTALPAGLRGLNGSFGSIDFGGYFWSSTESSMGTAWVRKLEFKYSSLTRDYNNKQFGLSVRCIRN